MFMALAMTFASTATEMAIQAEQTGSAGIASKYLNDIGIEKDPDVILADSFENYGKMSDLRSIWSTINEDHMNLCNESENIIEGNQSLQLNLPAQNIERYTGLDLNLTAEQQQDTIYIRYYQKIDESYQISNTTSNHNGGSISSRYWTCGDDSCPGICANGTNKYLAMLQSTQSSIFEGHSMMIYTYNPDQRYNNICPIPGMSATPRGSQYADQLYPDGEVLPWTYWRGDYGDDFIPRPKFNIELGKWYCYELMLKANTPGQRDGRITAWVDGEIILDFGNMRFRDVPDLKIDLIGFSFGCASNPVQTKSWFDNIVIAKSYIGPIAESDSEVLIGDINFDGKISISDIILLAKHLANRIELTETQLIPARTISNTDTVNSDCLLALIKFLIGDVTALPI